MEEVLDSARLTLRRVGPGDAGALTTAVNDPRIYRMVARIAPGQTKAQTLAWIAGLDRGRTEDTDHVFAILDGGAIAGVVGAHRTARDVPFEIGYWLTPAAWGKGIATEAAGRLMTALEGGGHRAFLAGYFADNPASGRVLRKLGFIPAGRGPAMCAGRGHAVDHMLMARIV